MINDNIESWEKYKMNIHDEFRIKVIEILHDNSNSLEGQKALNLPITLERVLKALDPDEDLFYQRYENTNELCFYLWGGHTMTSLKNANNKPVIWKLVKEDGFTPCTHEDQSEETIKTLLGVLR